MDRLGLILLLILLFIELAATNTYHVPDDFPTIQTAIKSAKDNDTILVREGTWDAFDFHAKNLTIKAAEGSFPVISSKQDIIVDLSNSSSSVLQGFTIIGNSENLGILILNAEKVNILNCTIQNTETGIQIDNCFGLLIINSTFQDNAAGIVISGNWSSFSALSLVNSVFSHNEAALLLHERCFLDLDGCRITDNGIGISQNYPTEIHAFWDRCTLSRNEIGIIWSSSSFNSITNSIIYNNTTNFTGTPASLNIEYSCIEGGYSGTGNIDSNPLFFSETGYEYHLLEGSPCIDAGVTNQTDSDGTRKDMGCYPTTTDIKYCEGNHWNWVSFPRLDREDDDPVNVVPLLEDFLDWSFNLELLYEDDYEPVLVYDASTNYWDPDEYDVQSTLGYKLDPQDTGDHYLPSQNGATRLPADWEIEELYEEEENWLGYWLPNTQNIVDAFGDFWDDVFSVNSEDWYYEYSSSGIPPSSQTANKNMVYGKSYIVVFERDVEKFCWNHGTESEEESEEMESQYFSFNDLSNYEAIDVMEIPENIIEIGVFQDETCVGAVVVDEEDEQILAYTSGQSPVSFEVVTGSRQTNQQVNNYSVFNTRTGLYENRTLISGQQKHSVVMFGNLEEQQNNTPSNENVVLHGNHPNPFNPETTISFSLTTESTESMESVELMIYNMKGQKVKQLFIGILTAGEYSFSWNGTDDEGKPVSSGLYLYKLKIGGQEFSKKMLLLK